MPDTEQCVLGAENKTRIINLEKAVDEIKVSVTRLCNHFSNRPTPTTLRLIAVMAALLGASVGVNATLITVLIMIIR